MLWLTSGIAEWWSLTLAERKRLLEIAVEEARAINPGIVIEACTAAGSAKDTVELTRHAQEHGADIAYLQTPPMEVHGGEGVLRFFQYVADRTDLALGMFNSPSSGYVLTPAEMAAIHDAIPAVVAVKQGVQDSIMPTLELHALAPELVIWECDTMVYEAGWLQDGIVGPAQLGTAGYLYETPDDKWYTHYWELIWAGDLSEARAFLQANVGHGQVRGVAHRVPATPGLLHPLG
jgi:4-hydroxy-tetrahydrodipicolinate synthase